MHELPVMQRVLDIVLKHAYKHGVQQVLTVQIEVGALSDLEEEWMQSYFQSLSQDTCAAEAKLKVERKPAEMLCLDCGELLQTYFAAGEELLCNSCNSSSLRLMSGREYTVVNLEAV